MASDKDSEQDELIRQNAEHIRRNEEAIRRQTEALEKIRDHYFPKRTVWKGVVGFGLKVIGAITIYTGVMEATEWYINARELERMAEQSAVVARRLLFEENDMAGAMKCLERSVELDGNNAKYRAELGYVRGMAAIVDLFDLGRPLQPDERKRVDEILAEAVFMRTAAPDDPMPYVLTAQAHALRKEFELSDRAIAKAVSLAPRNILVRCAGCAMRCFARDFAKARAELAEAEMLQPEFPIVLYWKGMLAVADERDFGKARECFEAMVRNSPRLALPHAMLGWALMTGPEPDIAAARAEFERALAINPGLKNVLQMMGESYEREGDNLVARLWYDRALEIDGRCTKALRARAGVLAKLGAWRSAADDLTRAIGLDPFCAGLYRERAHALEKCSCGDGAAHDRAMADALEKRR